MSNVLYIDASAFIYCSKLKTVSFSKAIVIGSYAFGYCSSLSSVSFPYATNIDYGAFSNCSSLSTATFPNVTSIYAYAFCSCSSLYYISLPCTNYIGGYAFQNCLSLSNISLPNTTIIADYAFYSTPISSIFMPNITYIGRGQFSNLFKSSTVVNYPKLSFMYDLKSAFSNNSYLGFVSLPNILGVPDYTFYSCSNRGNYICDL